MTEGISIKEKIANMKADYGVDLTAIVCGTQPRMLKLWLDDKRQPTELQAKTILSAYEVYAILCDLSVKEAKLWLVSNSDYLYGVPAIEIRKRPQDVILAALNLITRGEENLNPVDGI